MKAKLTKKAVALFENIKKIDEEGREYWYFVDVNDMVLIGSGATRTIETIRLSRYACYLTVQNADPSKTIVAQAQAYFAIQTCRYPKSA